MFIQNFNNYLKSINYQQIIYLLYFCHFKNFHHISLKFNCFIFLKFAHFLNFNNYFMRKRNIAQNFICHLMY